MKEPLLKIEAVNYQPGTQRVEPLYVLAVSAKRYVLFNLDKQGSPVIRKASAHGLSHLLPPYQEQQSPESIPPPRVPLADIGVKRWQYDLWYRIVEAALGQYPAQVRLEGLPGLGKPAMSRYAATSPALLGWFKRHNRGKSYRDQVKPFNFLLTFQAVAHPLAALPGGSPGVVVEEVEGPKTPGRGRKQATTGRTQPRPVAPYHPDPEQAIMHCFNRDDGKPIAREQLKTYREALGQYHLHPEAKFLHADYTDTGFTQRRHVQASCIEYIGKEANRWEERYYLGKDPEAQIVYGTSPEELERFYHCVLKACQRFKVRQLA